MIFHGFYHNYVFHISLLLTVCVIHIFNLCSKIMLFYGMIIVCTSYCVGIGISGFQQQPKAEKVLKLWMEYCVFCWLCLLYTHMFYSRVNRIKLNRNHIKLHTFFLNKFPHSNSIKVGNQKICYLLIHIYSFR